MRFLLNIFRRKRIRTFCPSASLSKSCPSSCALKAIQTYLLKSVSCYSASLSSPPRCLPSTDFWTIVVLYYSASLWNAVPLSSIYQFVICELYASPKFWFRTYTASRWVAVTLVNSSSCREICDMFPSKCLTTTVSLVLPLPSHPLPNWQPVWIRMLKGLSLQVSWLIVRQLECQTGAPGEGLFVEF